MSVNCDLSDVVENRAISIQKLHAGRPMVGFKWMEENWTPEECTATKKAVIDAVSTKITTKCHQSDCNPS